jgi:peptide-methionine (S)-S-oxide reductase
MMRPFPAAWIGLLLAAACSGPDNTASTAPADAMTPPPQAAENPVPHTELATFGAGCYWCVEAVLEQLDGVLDVRSGFMGGKVENPTYEQVCTGLTGHAEVVQVRFDPARIRYEELLAWFWKLHDPTTPDRQGNDIGPQYRSVIFWHDEAQRAAAERSKQSAQASGEFAAPIVTEIAQASRFYEADAHHQDYYRQNKQQGYCRYVIRPKLDKLGLEK